MTQEQIKELALKAYPERIFLFGEDVNKEKRKYLIEALKKASELLYSEEQMKDMWYDGWKSIAENQKEAEADIKAFLQSLKQKG